MRQELFSYFYSKIKNKKICELCSYFVYLLFILLFIIKKSFTSVNKFVSCSNPRELANSVYKKPEYVIEIQNETINETIDLSIIMPIYNYKDIIENCIESVINQVTKYNFELILVDDGSSDGASEIVDRYLGRKNIKVIHQINSGIGGARNTGINHATGKYISFVDCDDYLHHDFVEIMMDEAYKTNNDIVICSYSLVKKKDGKEYSRRDIVYSTNNLIGYKDEEDLIMNYQGLPWNKIYKREIFNKIRYIKGYWYEDTLTKFLVFPLCNSFSYVDNALYDYMWYENNFSHTQDKVTPKSIERYWILEVMEEEYERIGLKKDRKFYKILLRHLGRCLYSGIHGFDEEIKTAVFVLGCELLKKNKPKEEYSLTFMEKQLEKALLEQNIGLWEFLCETPIGI